MKIVAIAAEQFDGYQDVTVKFRLSSNEELEQGDIDRVLDLLRSEQEHDNRRTASRDTAKRPELAAPYGEQPKEEGGRRRRGASDPTPIEKAINESAPATGGRRRGASAPASNAQPPEDATTPETASTPSPSSGGRRRGTSNPSSTSPTAPAESQPTSSRGRRTSGGSAAGAESTKGSDKSYTDADMSAACSHAAMDIGAERVMEILKTEFQVAKSNLLPAGRRQEFIDRLKEEREGASEEKPTPQQASGRRRR